MSYLESSANPSSSVVAAFDFDKTLSSRDCVVPFLRNFVSLRSVIGLPRDVPVLLRSSLRRDRDSIKERITYRVLGGVQRSHIESTASRFADFVHRHWLRSDVLEKLMWHKEMGHRTGIVSASYGPYLRPIASWLGVEFVIATELEFDEFERATGRLLGRNCRGPEKARRLTEWMSAHGCVDAEVHAYGDSSGDKELLAMADHPNLVRPARSRRST